MYLSIYLSIYLSAFIYLSAVFIHLSICPIFHLSIYLSIDLFSSFLAIYLSCYTYIYIFIYLFIYTCHIYIYICVCARAVFLGVSLTLSLGFPAQNACYFIPWRFEKSHCNFVSNMKSTRKSIIVWSVPTSTENTKSLKNLESATSTSDCQAAVKILLFPDSVAAQMNCKSPSKRQVFLVAAGKKLLVAMKSSKSNRQFYLLH